MKTRLTFSWLVLLAGCVQGAYRAYSSTTSTDPLVSALSIGYAWWGLYWGLPVVFRWWCGLNFGIEWHWRLTKLFLGSALVPLFGYLYGICGGGIYQLLKAWWQTRR